MNELEQAARQAWLAWAVYRRFTHCHGCGLMQYCGAARLRGHWLCLECWDLRAP